MTSPAAQTLTLNELFQLVHFYAESGVDWLLEDEPQDRFAEFAALEARRAQPSVQMAGEAPVASTQPRRRPDAPPQAPAARMPVAIPDAEAAAEARRLAAAAQSLPELVEAVAGFAGCNLRNSARTTAFLAGNFEAKLAIVAGLPSADDDRDGRPFAGPSGAMLERMLKGIGLAPDVVLLANLVPWRPPGNRQPTAHEAEICRPFGLRALELLQPEAVLALGNFSARFFSGSNETIHALRGKWMEVPLGSVSAPVLTTFHPQDLVAAPLCKRFAWADLLAFRAKLTV